MGSVMVSAQQTRINKAPAFRPGDQKERPRKLVRTQEIVETEEYGKRDHKKFHTMEYCSTIKRNELLIHTTKEIDLKDIR